MMNLTTTILNNIGLLKHDQGELQEARGYFEQAHRLLRDQQEATPTLARVVNNLATVYVALGNLADAEPLYLQSLKLREELYGYVSSTYATVLHNLGLLYTQQGRYYKARQVLESSLAIFEKVSGEEHPDYAKNLSALSYLIFMLGDYRTSRALNERTLAIQKNIFGEMHPDIAYTLDNLATVEWYLGDYRQAETYYSQSEKIIEAFSGKNHPDYATHLNQIGQYYAQTGRFEAAEFSYQSGLEIALASGSPLQYATIAHNLALVYLARGDYGKALPLLEKVIDARVTELGDNHPDVAQSVDIYYSTIGILDPDKAVPLLEKALMIRRSLFGEEHPETAFSLNNLGYLHFLRGDFQRAEIYLQEAYQVRLKVFGRDHPDQARTLTSLAIVNAGQGRILEALDHINAAAEVHDHLIDKIFTLGSEQQRMEYLAGLQNDFHAYISLVYRYLSDDIHAIERLFHLILRRKGIGVEVLAVQKSVILSGRYPGLSASLQELNSVQAQIAYLTLNPLMEVDLENTLTALNGRKENLEAAMARQIPELSLTDQLNNLDLAEIARKLPIGSALIEFFRFEDMDFPKAGMVGGVQFLSIRYLAFVIIADQPDAIKMIDLGPASEIDANLEAWRSAITGTSAQSFASVQSVEPSHASEIRRNIIEFSRQIGSRDRTNASGNGEKEGILLRQAVFDPLLSALGICNRLFLAPDGNLTRLPFEALPLDEHHFLIDKYSISYLSVGRDLLHFDQKYRSSPGPALVIASPDYNLGSEDLPDDSLGDPFPALEGAKQEGENVAKALEAELWSGADALEGTLKQQRSPNVLHISTHGFFIEQDSFSSMSNSFRQSANALYSGRLSQLRDVQNPLIRSGLALAGANTWIRQGILHPNSEDGLLIAVDVTGLDLLDTDLVTLSACDTGLGWVQAGEGVFGLRRAFTIAGTRTLVMKSLENPR